MPVVSEKPVLPVTIVSGYLGSGKTTLINGLLGNAAGVRLAVLVNDFGELAIDSQLIESRDGNVISLSGGCVCCSYGNDLVGALLELEPNCFDQVVIEASGVALPGAIAGSLSLLSEFVVNAIVVLADASTIEQQTRDKYLADTVTRQLTAADLIVLNKLDLISTQDIHRIERSLTNCYPASAIVCAPEAQVVATVLMAKISENTSRELGEAVIHDVAAYKTFTLKVDKKQDVEKLARSLSDRDLGLLRVKGFVQDVSGEMKTVQIVGQRWSVQAAPDDVKCGLVCIGLSGHCCEAAVRAGVS